MADELIRCPSCNNELRLPRELLGQTVECPQCGSRFGAPAPSRAPVVRTVGESTPAYSGEMDAAAQRASQSLRAPAIALIITSILSMGADVLGLVSAAGVHADPNAFHAGMQKSLNDNPDLTPDQRQWIEQNFTAEAVASNTSICCGIQLVVNLAVLLGAVQMLRQRFYGFAVLASILALNPVNAPICLVQLPFGLWALIVLLDSNVRRSFS
jgi:DNA-directed RNA polymerase subunit RPC12/RpoP